MKINKKLLASLIGVLFVISSIESNAAMQTMTANIAFDTPAGLVKTDKALTYTVTMDGTVAAPTMTVTVNYP
jgi:hypothetical protein